MRHIPFSLIAALLVSLSSCAAPPSAQTTADLLDTVKANKKLRVSTDANYRPQSYFDEATKTWSGFDIDVARETARRLGVEVEFVTPDWSAITAGNWARRWDVSIGSMTITPERAEVLDFTSPYYYTPAQFAIRADLKDTVRTLADLSGRTVCVGEATTYEQYLNGKLTIQAVTPPPTGVKVATVKTDADCVQSIRAGRKDYDAVLTAWGVVDDSIKQGISIVALGDPVYYEDLAMALDKAAKPNAKMLAELNRIIAEMHADGTLSRLSMQYYGHDLTKKKSR
ncbi:MAG: transporter substrate-binding domain-containing protein [Thermoflexales bacterium]